MSQNTTTEISTIILGLVAIIMLSVGQTSLKIGLNHIGGVSLAHGVASLLKLFHTPWVIVGFVCYGISSILWLDVLSKLEFSIAFPMVGLTYVLTLLIGYFLFQEPVTMDRVLGVGLIVLGIFFLSRSSSSW
jgi:multidrug transporter EmrE-like cation transporter